MSLFLEYLNAVVHDFSSKTLWLSFTFVCGWGGAGGLEKILSERWSYMSFCMVNINDVNYY